MNPVRILAAQFTLSCISFLSLCFAGRDSYHDGNDDNDNDDHDENENDGAHELAPAKHLLKSVLDRLQK
jgi:hypothetical protein